MYVYMCMRVCMCAHMCMHVCECVYYVSVYVCVCFIVKENYDYRHNVVTKQLI